MLLCITLFLLGLFFGLGIGASIAIELTTYLETK